MNIKSSIDLLGVLNNIDDYYNIESIEVTINNTTYLIDNSYDNLEIYIKKGSVKKEPIWWRVNINNLIDDLNTYEPTHIKIRSW